MSAYFGFNRRSIGDRRVLDAGGNCERCRNERRKCGGNNYALVLGNTGINRCGLVVACPVLLLIATVLIGVFIRT